MKKYLLTIIDIVFIAAIGGVWTTLVLNLSGQMNLLGPVSMCSGGIVVAAIACLPLKRFDVSLSAIKKTALSSLMLPWYLLLFSIVIQGFLPVSRLVLPSPLWLVILGLAVFAFKLFRSIKNKPASVYWKEVEPVQSYILTAFLVAILFIVFNFVPVMHYILNYALSKMMFVFLPLAGAHMALTLYRPRKATVMGPGVNANDK